MPGLRADTSPSEWWSGGERVTLTITGVERDIFIRTDGDGPTVTILHGYPSSSWDWVPVISLVGSRCRTVCFDFLGFGSSDKPSEHAYSIDEQADVVGAVWAELGITETILVAHDYGSTVGQELLARRADGLGPLIHSSLWLNAGLYPEAHRPTEGQKALLDDTIGPEISAAMTLEMFGAGFSLVFGEGTKPSDAELADHWSVVSRDDGHARLHDLLHYIADRRQHRERYLSAFEAVEPAPWLVWGLADPVSGRHMLAPVRAGRRGIRVTELADIGHYPQLEHPGAVAAAIEELVSM
jgi:pimeloyl-ACP methyl ester carboxylesterase